MSGYDLSGDLHWITYDGFQLLWLQTGSGISFQLDLFLDHDISQLFTEFVRDELLSLRNLSPKNILGR